MTNTLIPCPHCGQPINPAQLMRQIKSEKRSEASRQNGSKPVRPGSRPRGRPKTKKEGTK